MPDSFDYTTGTNSENVRLLQALIDDAPEYTEETNSRNANILKSIINNTEYTDAPQSEIEELLLRLKAKIGGEIEVDELNVTENGTYDAGVNKAYNPVTVELPLNGKTITENGTYTASDDNLAGYDEVTVAVQGYAKKSIANTPTAIATFNASALPMPSLKVSIEAVQSGTGDPSPQNIRPFTGWSSVELRDTTDNIWGGSDMKNDFVRAMPSTTVDTTNKTLTFSASATVSDTLTINHIKFKPNTQYTIILRCANSRNATTTNLWVRYTDGTSQYIDMPTASADTKQTVVLVTTAGKSVNFINKINSNGNTTIWYEESGIFEGVLTESDFVPYNGTTTSISLGETVYNAELDVINGEGTSGYYPYTFTGNESGGDYYGAGLYLTTGVPTNITQGGICEFCTMKSVTGNPQVNEGVIANGSAGVGNVAFNLDGITTLADLKTFVAGKKILFKIATSGTPETFTATPTQISTISGINNLWADSGDIQSGEYMEAL